MEKPVKDRDNFSARGELRIKIQRASGGIEKYQVKNLMVQTGTDFVAARMIGNTPAVVSHMAVGSGTNAAAAGDTSLQSQLGSRVPVIASRAASTVTYTATFAAGVGTGSITEAGLFNAATGGTMTCRSVFGVKTKDPGDVMTIEWDNVIEAA